MTTQEKLEELNDSVSKMKDFKSKQRSTGQSKVDNSDLRKTIQSVIDLTEWVIELLSENEKLKSKQNNYQRVVYKSKE